MRNTISLTVNQLACLLVAASVGSAIIYIPAPLSHVAGNGSWLSVAGAYLFGMLTLGCVIYLHRRHGEAAGLFGYCRKLLGRAITPVVLVPVIGMLFFAVSAIVTGISDFFTSGMMPYTPPYVFCSVSLAASALTARSGVKNTARMFVLLVPVMIVFSLVVLVLAMPLYDWGRLLPIADKGFKPLLHGLIIAGGFPFGEVFLLSVFLPYTAKEDEKLLAKRLFRAFTVNGALILISSLCTTAAFGPAADHFNYSLFHLASNADVSGTNLRAESVIGMALILGSYMKATVFLIILNRLLVQLLGARDEAAFIYPASLVCVLLSLTLFSSPADFLFQVYTIWPSLVIGIGCALVFLLAALSWLRGRFEPRERSDGR